MQKQFPKGEFPLGGFVIILVVGLILGIIFFFYGYPKFSMYFNDDGRPAENPTPGEFTQDREGGDTEPAANEPAPVTEPLPPVEDGN